MKNKKTLRLKKGQFLKDIMDIFPTNTEIHKTLTGIGSTSLLLEHPTENCIIIVPNVPVIKGKCKKYNKKRKIIVKGVYDGVTIGDIIAYLNSPQIPKRLITTPESYIKIKHALEEIQEYDIYKDFFFLIDECERLVQDVNYREKIILPFNDFFKFDNRAMVSATTMEMTDPRFKLHRVKKLTIVPDFDYKETINLITTNNIELSLQNFITKNKRDQYFIFHNSVDSIVCLIKRLKLEEDSAIFCGMDSAKKLRGDHVKNVNTDINQFKKYNFLTSRFFSALDIDGISNPTIIMLTDLYFAEHTAIDPVSQSIQIQGRFRREKGKELVKEVTHITNLKPMFIKSDQSIISEIETGQIIHRFLKRYVLGATTNGAVKTIKELLRKVENQLAVTENSEINHFLKDNMIFDNKIKSYYTSFDNLISAYDKSKYFNVTPNTEEYIINDEIRIQLLNKENLRPKSLLEILVRELSKIQELKRSNPFQAMIEECSILSLYPKEAALLNEITLKRAEELGHDIRKIRMAIKEKQMEKEVTNFEFIAYLEKSYALNRFYPNRLYKSILKNGIDQFRLFTLNPTLLLLKKYFNVDESRATIDNKRVRGVTILSRNNLNLKNPLGQNI